MSSLDGWMGRLHWKKTPNSVNMRLDLGPIKGSPHASKFLAPVAIADRRAVERVRRRSAATRTGDAASGRAALGRSPPRSRPRRRPRRSSPRRRGHLGGEGRAELSRRKAEPFDRSSSCPSRGSGRSSLADVHRTSASVRVEANGPALFRPLARLGAFVAREGPPDLRVERWNLSTPPHPRPR